MLAQVRSDPSSFLSDWQLSESDRDKLAERAGYEILRQTIEEAFVHGVWGYVDDTLCLVRRGASMFPRSVSRRGSSTALPTCSCRDNTAIGWLATFPE
jgi:hypothetical protein